MKKKYKKLLSVTFFFLGIYFLKPLLIPLSSFYLIYSQLLDLLILLGCLSIILTLLKYLNKESEKEDVLSLTAHQLISPLISTKWGIEMLLHKESGEINEKQKQILNKILEKNKNLISIVENFLDVSKLENRFSSLNPENEVDLEKITDAVIDFYQPEIINKKINLIFEKSEEKLPKINADPEKIKIAIQNLLENALEYSYPGGEIIISLKKKGNKIIFKIQDFGIGINKKEQKKIFNKFFRAKEAVKKIPWGYGLGLYFTKNIIKAHKGKIWFNSEVGKGTTFYFSLPLKNKKCFLKFIFSCF